MSNFYGEQWYQDLYPWGVEFRTRTFTEIFPSLKDFQDAYDESQLNLDGFAAQSTGNEVTEFYYLMYAKYGNSHIASSDENQFKYKMWALLYSYGPAWRKRISIQQEIRALTNDDLAQGGKAIYNKALNPEDAPTTQSLEELTYISEQNVTNYKKTKIEALSSQWEMLATDVTDDFLAKFRQLFITITAPEGPLIYGG